VDTLRRMRSLVRLSLLFTLTSTIPAALAEGPEIRDHRDAPVVVAPGPGPSTSLHYRKRPGPRFMMPLKVDIGATGIDTAHGYAPGIGVAVGIHWASLSPEPTNTDVGIGVFGALLGAPAQMDTATGAMSDNNAIAYGGAYLEVGHTLAHGDWWRTWAAGRGEYIGTSAFGNETHTGFGATGRLSAELYVHGVGIEPRGVFLGTYALGVYVEAGARDLGPDVGTFHVGGGLTFRTPLVFAP
jgi:hypothetical protein